MIWIDSKDYMNQVLVPPPFQALVWIVLDNQYNFVAAAFLGSFTFSMDSEPQRFKNTIVGTYRGMKGCFLDMGCSLVERVLALEQTNSVLVFRLLLSSSVTRGKLLNFPKPQFPHP